MTRDADLREVDRELVVLIGEWRLRSPWPPTIRELTRAAELGSTSTTAYHLDKCRDVDLVWWERYEQRRLALVDNVVVGRRHGRPFVGRAWRPND